MITEDQRMQLFTLYPVLSGVEQELLERVLSGAEIMTLARGTLIFDELQPCDAFPFVLSGDLRVFKRSVKGRELSLYHVLAGDACIVTAGCLLGDKVYNASGQVKKEVRMVMIPAREFDVLLESKVFRAFVFSLISHRIMHLMQLVEEVAFSKLDRRLASLLISQGESIRMSHQDLADELGTVREMVTRVLNSFSDASLIKLSRGQIEIIDGQGLKLLLKS